ncbi:hypothetical protein [Devosia sp.]|nr:hypothetical protein [Devosia sp.]
MQPSLGAGIGTGQSITGMASKINSAEVENHGRQHHRKQAMK